MIVIFQDGPQTTQSVNLLLPIPIALTFIFRKLYRKEARYHRKYMKNEHNELFNEFSNRRTKRVVKC